MRSLWDRLKYRMEYHGTYMKDGKVCQKYLKSRRFPHLTRRRLAVALFVAFVSLAAAGFVVWIATEKFPAPAPETAMPSP